MDNAKSNLLLKQKDISILEIEIVSNYISNIRSSVFKILTILLDNEYFEIAKQLRRNIFYSLKVPHNNWGNILINTPFEQPGSNILAIYGEDISNAISDINHNLEHVFSFGNPLNKVFVEFLTKLNKEDKCIVFTESKFKSDFESLINNFDIPTFNLQIISTISEYKQLEIFNTLLVVGSIRADEYSIIPSFFLRNIKFHRLVQLKWSGQKNDYGAFHTPIARLRELFTGEPSRLFPVEKQNLVVNFDCKLPKTARYQEDIDEFEIYKKLTLDSFPAFCFKLSQGKSVFYSPNSKLILIVKENSATSVQYIKANDAANLANDEVLIASFNTPVQYSNDRNTEAFCYQHIWKGVLLEQDFDTFLGELERSNVGLKNLSFCISEWCEISDNVVKAPQEKENFLILLDCLKKDIVASIDLDDFDSWVEAAWREVLSSRGEAISGGLQYNSEYEELVYHAIKKLLKVYSQSVNTFLKEGLSVSINSEKCPVELHQLQSIEYGYEVPKKLLKQVVTEQESNFYK